MKRKLKFKRILLKLSGEVLDDDDTLSFTVTINGAVGTIDAAWKH